MLSATLLEKKMLMTTLSSKQKPAAPLLTSVSNAHNVLTHYETFEEGEEEEVVVELEQQQPEMNKYLNLVANYNLCVMFLHQDERTAQFLWNRLAAIFTRSEIIHVELYFEHVNLTCSVSSGAPVAFRKRNYSSERNRHWSGMQLSLPANLYFDIYNFCASRQGEPFDNYSIYFFPLLSCFSYCKNELDDNRYRSWICSRLVMCAFQAAGLGLENRVESYTPASIETFMLKLPDTEGIQVTPLPSVLDTSLNFS